MYIVISQEPLKVLTFESKTDLSSYLNIHRNTITNRFNEKKSWECDKGVVYQSDKHKKMLRSGNKDSNMTKKLKREGQMPCNDPKLNKGYID